MPLFYFRDPCRFELQESYRGFLAEKVEEYSQRLDGKFRLGKSIFQARKPSEGETLRNTAKLTIGRLALEGGVVTRQIVVDRLKSLPADTAKGLFDIEYRPFTHAQPIFDHETHEYWAGYPTARRLNGTLISVTDAYNVIKSYTQTGHQQNIL